MSSAQGHRAQQGALRRPGGVKPQRSSHDTFRPHRQPFKRRLTEGHHLEGATRHKGGGSHEQCILILEIRTLGAENLIWPIMMQSEPPPRGGHTALGTNKRKVTVADNEDCKPSTSTLGQPPFTPAPEEFTPAPEHSDSEESQPDSNSSIRELLTPKGPSPSSSPAPMAEPQSLKIVSVELWTSDLFDDDLPNVEKPAEAPVIQEVAENLTELGQAPEPSGTLLLSPPPSDPAGPPPATAPPDHGNSTAGTRGAAPPAAGATAPPATSAVSNTIAPPVDDKSCGADTGHINTCLSQTSHDVSTCAPSDDFCLCQAYANLANCYNGCDSLHSQQQQYHQQSDQHCNAPGVADKLRAAKNSPSNLPPGPPSDNHDPRTSARSAASADFQFPFHGFLTLISSTLALAVF
ncbi:hypothetical protein PCANC_25705 [Puccinia coronata f. sp. avenae]|uniref:Uncharacterized protein n=1 Tax=Puccinia coronata f. sp. avenae TaxID=200324 RepID=A0A2N5S3F1_9BASI|nr:hypothetical protein PCANC_25705 [Puccinia coronata f. sp. avenae]